MTPFEQAVQPKVTAEELKAKFTKTMALSDEEWALQAKRLNENEVWMNDTYQVNLTRSTDWLHISIKRIDKNPLRVWRDLQTIKNRFAGPEAEAVELFPAESRLVDSANQYHLWVFLGEPNFKWPFGFNERFVRDGTGELEPDGYRQEPLKKEKI